jgi:hypothetical protein
MGFSCLEEIGGGVGDRDSGETVQPSTRWQGCRRKSPRSMACVHLARVRLARVRLARVHRAPVHRRIANPARPLCFSEAGRAVVAGEVLRVLASTFRCKERFCQRSIGRMACARRDSAGTARLRQLADGVRGSTRTALPFARNVQTRILRTSGGSAIFVVSLDLNWAHPTACGRIADCRMPRDCRRPRRAGCPRHEGTLAAIPRACSPTPSSNPEFYEQNSLRGVRDAQSPLSWERKWGESFGSPGERLRRAARRSFFPYSAFRSTCLLSCGETTGASRRRSARVASTHCRRTAKPGRDLLVARLHPVHPVNGYASLPSQPQALRGARRAASAAGEAATLVEEALPTAPPPRRGDPSSREIAPTGGVSTLDVPNRGFSSGVSTGWAGWPRNCSSSRRLAAASFD